MLGRDREDHEAGVHPVNVGKRGQGLLDSLSLQVTSLASTYEMTLLSLLGFSYGRRVDSYKEARILDDLTDCVNTNKKRAGFDYR